MKEKPTFAFSGVWPVMGHALTFSNLFLEHYRLQFIESVSLNVFHPKSVLFKVHRLRNELIVYLMLYFFSK